MPYFVPNGFEYKREAASTTSVVSEGVGTMNDCTSEFFSVNKLCFEKLHLLHLTDNSKLECKPAQIRKI